MRATIDNKTVKIKMVDAKYNVEENLVEVQLLDGNHKGAYAIINKNSIIEEKKAKFNAKAWNIVHESDDEETGEPTVWAKRVDSVEFGDYMWIAKAGEEEYHVEYIDGDLHIAKVCKSLSSAKKWVTMYA